MKVYEFKKLFTDSRLTKLAFADAYNISIETVVRYLKESDDDAFVSRQIELRIKKQIGILPANATVDDLLPRARPSEIERQTRRFRERYLEIYGDLTNKNRQECSLAENNEHGGAL